MFDLILPILRHALQLLAGYLVGAGLMSADLSVEVIGAGLSLATLIWWFAEQRKRPAFSLVRPVLRHALQLGAGLLVGSGAVPPEIGAELVGGAMSIATLGWWFLEKRK
ncbi:MAG: hypothetical protein WD046_13805 [Paracoccaceae bacterium]